MNRRRSDGLPVSFLDLVFIIAFSFVILFILALIFMAEAKKHDEGKIIPKAEFLITLEWTPESDDDLDLWVRGPGNTLVSFRRREHGHMHLDKDDLGRTNDAVVIDGVTTYIDINQEVVTLRGMVPGRYTVNVHVYGRRSEIDNEATLSVVKLNPFRQVAKVTKIFNIKGQEQTMISFTIDERGNVVDIDTSDDLFIMGARRQMNEEGVPR